MVPLILLALTAVALVAAVLAVAGGRLRVDGLADAVTTTPDHGLADHPDAADVPAVRFDTAARGYRPAEVDEHLEHLRTALAEREAEVARLRGEGR
ncbi:DivIVA domain-containing protein [Phycicoccus sp. BSK3Z-2]|uniref:DivIVA domain-containing protein n=1 Tax=Phycicoccus avicenniae TaxID=2828860 RepID=A0A941D750_9MICO|nr:DivIVA domain-containing protein [Phycicoccus avicenniae]MBR7742963.1 DivIVA domain-containing protein [Phycicoccus avicenniae]